LAKDENINVKLTSEQRKFLKDLIGEMGSNEPEIIRNIFLAWASEHGLMSEIIKKRWKEKK
jgi:hypothetical protein